MTFRNAEEPCTVRFGTKTVIDKNLIGSPQTEFMSMKVFSFVRLSFDRFVMKTESCHVAQNGLELVILPSQPPAAGIRAVYSASKLGLN